ncbi:MAG: methyltransferase type 11 [Deltaproteobacteria bacterium HGW-Deltaproteobacteria-8]|jgi:SAM-dependent methyltransferase|nr:MAG: methyltransferase type 11 [Deltaproteobacteria bacterium HGW-Deltaproteobacteria-8]
MLKRLLAHPLTRGLAPDDPLTTTLRRQIIREKGLLRRLYLEWYTMLAGAVPPGPGAILELGSGAGFLKEVLPQALASEVFFCPGVDVILDGCRLPLRDGSLKALLMVDVFHHLPDAERMLAEAVRTLAPGGCLAMLEPWVSTWSRFVYARLHPEPFEPEAVDWRFEPSGPLSGANSALPWMVFQRDRERFAARFPELQITALRPGYPLSYLASGGVSLRSLAPGWSYPLWRGVEGLLSPLLRHVAMFAFITLRRR